MNPFNELTPAELERLAFLAEEMGEALHAIGKILRHGYRSCDPTKDPFTDENAAVTNRTMLEMELGDVRAAMILLCSNDDLSKAMIHARADAKLESVRQWMHHQ